jgi:hypothetical protein
MKARCDRGYLYFALIANGGDIPMMDVHQWVEQALPAAGLPGLAEVRDAIAADLRVIGTDALDGQARNRLDKVPALGRDYYEPVLSRGQLSIQHLDVPIPPVLIQGDRFITFKGGPRNGTFGDPGAWLEEAYLYHALTREFVNACVI